MPLEWIDYREAARLYHQEQVAYTCGSLLYRLYGGVNARTRPAHDGGRQFDRRHRRPHRAIRATTRHDYVPPLNNETLFRRDAYLCMYCGARFP